MHQVTGQSGVFPGLAVRWTYTGHAHHVHSRLTSATKGCVLMPVGVREFSLLSGPDRSKDIQGHPIGGSDGPQSKPVCRHRCACGQSQVKTIYMYSRYAPWCSINFALPRGTVARTLYKGAACCLPHDRQGDAPKPPHLHTHQRCSASLPTSMYTSDVHSQPTCLSNPAPHPRPLHRPRIHPLQTASPSWLPVPQPLAPCDPTTPSVPCDPTAPCAQSSPLQRSRSPAPPIRITSLAYDTDFRSKLATPLHCVSRHGQHVFLWAHHHRVVVVADGARREAAGGAWLLHHIHHQLHALNGGAVEHAVLHAVIKLRACMSTEGGMGVKFLPLCDRYSGWIASDAAPRFCKLSVAYKEEQQDGEEA